VLTAAAAMAGKMDPATATLEELRRVQPNISLACMELLLIRSGSPIARRVDHCSILVSLAEAVQQPRNAVGADEQAHDIAVVAGRPGREPPWILLRSECVQAGQEGPHPQRTTLSATRT